MTTSFNPCCLGSVGEASGERVLCQFHFEFQSLLSWISRRSLSSMFPSCSSHSVSILVVLDQSAKQARYAPRALETPGFNPCCLGSVGEARRLPRDGSAVDMFQSLLSWISRRSCERWVRDAHFRVCFNPCCLGSVGEATSEKSAARPFDVSILVVLDQSAKPGDPNQLAGRLKMFQSLLSWISRRSICRDVPDDLIAGFNPCCLGSVGEASSRCVSGAN